MPNRYDFVSTIRAAQADAQRGKEFKLREKQVAAAEEQAGLEEEFARRKMRMAEDERDRAKSADIQRESEFKSEMAYKNRALDAGKKPVEDFTLKAMIDARKGYGDDAILSDQEKSEKGALSRGILKRLGVSGPAAPVPAPKEDKGPGFFSRAAGAAAEAAGKAGAAVGRGLDSMGDDTDTASAQPPAERTGNLLDPYGRLGAFRRSVAPAVDPKGRLGGFGEYLSGLARKMGGAGADTAEAADTENESRRFLDKMREYLEAGKSPKEAHRLASEEWK